LATLVKQFHHAEGDAKELKNIRHQEESRRENTGVGDGLSTCKILLWLCPCRNTLPHRTVKEMESAEEGAGELEMKEPDRKRERER